MELFYILAILFIAANSYFSFSAGRINGTMTTFSFLQTNKCLKPLTQIKDTGEWPDALKKLYNGTEDTK